MGKSKNGKRYKGIECKIIERAKKRARAEKGGGGVWVWSVGAEFSIFLEKRHCSVKKKVSNSVKNVKMSTTKKGPGRKRGVRGVGWARCRKRAVQWQKKMSKKCQKVLK